MKNQSPLNFRLPWSARTFGTILLLLFSLCAYQSARAQGGTWTNDFDSVWSDTTNWLNGVVANGAGNTAIFSNDLASTVVVDMDSARTIGNLEFPQGLYTITNGGLDGVNILTLSSGSKPRINVPSGAQDTIRRTVVAGTDGFVLDGGGQLNLFKENTDPDNSLTGSVVISNGIIQIQGINANDQNLANTHALTNVTSFTFYNGTLNLQPAVNTTPDYGNVNGNLHVPADGVGTIVIPVRFTGSAGDNSAAIGSGLGGNLTGSGTFNVRSRYVRGNVVGDWSAFTGILDIGPSSANADNSFRFGNPSGFPNADVRFNGATALDIVYYRQLTSNTNIPIGRLSGNNPLNVLVGSASAGFTLFWDVCALQSNPANYDTYAGSIRNGAGPAGLIKRGPGTLEILGNCTHTGPNTISNGVLRIGDGSSDAGSIGTGPITNYGALIFAHGNGLLTVPGVISGTGALTNSGQGGTLLLSGSNTYSAPTVSTAGKLIMSSASKATGAVILQDQAEGFGVRMGSPNTSLNISGLSYSAAGTFDCDLLTLPNPTVAVVTNTGNLALNGDVTVNVSGSGLSAGTITLLQYGSRSGSGNFVLGSLPPQVTGFSFNDDTANKRVILTISATFDSTLRWEGGVAGVWDIDNTANQIWREIGSGQLTNYYAGAKVRFDDSATGTTVVDVSTTVFPASVIVSNVSKAYRFAGFGAISGTTSLIKDGSNKLTITNANDYSGPTHVNAGTLEIGDGVTDGSIGGGVITNAGTILLNRPTGPVTMANAIHGTGNVIQTGPGQVNLSGASTYSGGLTLKPGTILGYNNGNAAGIGGGLRVENATVALGADVFNNVGNTVIITNATFTATANRVIDTPVFGTNVIVLFDKSALITLNRDISGISGVVTNQGTGLLRFNSGGGNNATGSTNVLWVFATSGGYLQPRNLSVNFLGAVEGIGGIGGNSTAGGNNIVTWNIGGLNMNTMFSGIINDFGRNVNITKVGSGTWTLSSATMSYRSSTVVSNGTLALSGSTSPEFSTNIVVAAPGILNVSARDDGTLTVGNSGGTNNQTLGGNGTIVGNVTFGSRGRLEPGFSIGILTNTGTFTCGGTNVFEFDGLTTASDRLVANTINYGGTLILTNTGGTVNGTKTYKLFQANTINAGSGFTVITQAIAGVSYDLSQLNTAGTVTLTGPGAPVTPTNIVFQVSSNQLELSWPPSYIAWTLVTNANVANTNTWFPYLPLTSGNTNRVFVTINPALSNVFYQLRLPQP